MGQAPKPSRRGSETLHFAMKLRASCARLVRIHLHGAHDSTHQSSLTRGDTAVALALVNAAAASFVHVAAPAGVRRARAGSAGVAGLCAVALLAFVASLVSAALRNALPAVEPGVVVGLVVVVLIGLIGLVIPTTGCGPPS